MTATLEWSTLRVTGSHATTFLDGQLTQDLADARGGAWALLLEPSSDVITSAWVRADGDAWELLVPRAAAETAAGRLRRFLIRIDCTIEIEENAHDVPFTSVHDQIALRLPWFVEFSHALSPHSFGASFVSRAVSFTKGCYTGQELVGRADARGATMPWRFIYASGPSVEAINEVLRRTGPAGPQGVTTSEEREGDVHALGFAHRTFARATEPADHVVIEEIA